MHCPDCGCELDLKTDICPDCGSNFEGMSDNEKKRVFNRPLPSTKRKLNTNVDPGNVNGYVVEEGRSIHGGKLKKGSSTSRGGSRVTGHDSNTVVRKAVHNINALHKDDDEDKKQRRIKLDYETKKEIEKDILGIEDLED